jgi:hypothetical protein
MNVYIKMCCLIFILKMWCKIKTIKIEKGFEIFSCSWLSLNNWIRFKVIWIFIVLAHWNNSPKGTYFFARKISTINLAFVLGSKIDVLVRHVAIDEIVWRMTTWVRKSEDFALTRNVLFYLHAMISKHTIIIFFYPMPGFLKPTIKEGFTRSLHFMYIFCWSHW